MPETTWRRPSKCESSGCFEAAILDGAVFIRNSHNPRVAIPFTHGEWTGFLDAVKAGEFDPDQLPGAWPVPGAAEPVEDSESE